MTLNIYKALLLTLLFIVPFQLSIAYADSVKDEKKSKEWLYVVTSKEAEITKNKKGQYVLSLEHAKIERVLAFTDRPNRDVSFISLIGFKRSWKSKNPNSFKTDPPNAVAVFGQAKIAMTLKSASVNKNSISFIINSDDDNLKSVKTGPLSLFVDDNAGTRRLTRRCCQFGAGHCPDDDQVCSTRVTCTCRPPGYTICYDCS